MVPICTKSFQTLLCFLPRWEHGMRSEALSRGGRGALCPFLSSCPGERGAGGAGAGAGAAPPFLLEPGGPQRCPRRRPVLRPGVTRGRGQRCWGQALPAGGREPFPWERVPACGSEGSLPVPRTCPARTQTDTRRIVAGLKALLLSVRGGFDI